MSTLTLTAANGVAFTARILRPGDRYGMNGIHGPCVIEPGGKPEVEFFDNRYPHDPYAEDEHGIEKRGQFTGGRYYVETILGQDKYGSATGGLVLDSGIPDWRIDAATMDEFRSWIATEILRPGAEAVLASVKERFNAYIAAGDGDEYQPTLRPREDSPGAFEIVWESGSPFEWSMLASGGGVDEEMASLGSEFGYVPAPLEPVSVPAGVYVEPVNGITLGIYPA